jgi:serine/threonine-protein kinase
VFTHAEKGGNVGFELGKSYGGYEFIDVLDSSRQEICYRVRNIRMGRMEMLRVLSRQMEEDVEKEERFLREAGIHSRLQHPNLVSFYGATRLQGHFVITTELIEGVTVEEKLDLGPLPAGDALDIARQALAALGAAHNGGVSHRDVRPANLIVTPERLVKLTGFSLAKGESDHTLTQMGTFLGHVHYMSPEQVRGVSNVDGRSDIYSMAVVLYEMLTGKKLFENQSHFDVMMAHVNTSPLAVGDLCPGLPAGVEPAILRALAKRPEDRFSSAGEFADALSGKQPQPQPALTLEHLPGARIIAAPVECAPLEQVRIPAASVELWTAPEIKPATLPPPPIPVYRDLALLSLGVIAVIATAMLFARF